MQQFEDAALNEIAEQQKLGPFQAHPLQAGTLPGKTATKKKRTAPRPRLMTQPCRLQAQCRTQGTR